MDRQARARASPVRQGNTTVANNDFGTNDAFRQPLDRSFYPRSKAAPGAGPRKNVRSLGVVYEQKFYGLLVRDDAKSPVFWPGRRFAALIDCHSPVGAERLRWLARVLLDRGCVALHILGDPVEAALLSASFDAIVDAEPHHAPEGRSPYSNIEVDPAGRRETLAEALEWFVCPNGYTTTSLVAVIGGERDFSRLIGHFAQAVGDLRERIIPNDPCMFPGIGGWFGSRATYSPDFS